MHKSNDFSQCCPFLLYNVIHTFAILQIVFVSTRTPGEMFSVKNGAVDVMRNTFTAFKEGHDRDNWVTERSDDMQYDISMGTRGASTSLPPKMTYELFKYVMQYMKVFNRNATK